MRYFKFILGFLIGCLLVYVMLIRGRDRDLKSWFPERRIIGEIQQAELAISELAQCKLDCFGISESDLDELIGNASVRFGKSQVRKRPCPVYFLESGFNSKTFFLEIEKCDGLANLLKIGADTPAATCNCST